MENQVTVVLTSCGRADLLKKTIETFLQFNTYPIKNGSSQKTVAVQ